MKQLDVLAELSRLQALRAEQTRRLAADAARAVRAAGRAAEQAHATHANRRALWHVRMASAAVGVDDLSNARAAIDAARAGMVAAQARAEQANEMALRARATQCAAEAALTAVRERHRRHLRRSRSHDENRMLTEVEDMRVARLASQADATRGGCP